MKTRNLPRHPALLFGPTAAAALVALSLALHVSCGLDAGGLPSPSGSTSTSTQASSGSGEGGSLFSSSSSADSSSASSASSGSSGAGGAGGGSGAGGAPTLPATWHSWDVQSRPQMGAVKQEMFVLDTNMQNHLALIAFVSNSLKDLNVMGGAFNTYNLGVLQDGFSNLNAYWTLKGMNYPYAGKSTIDRGGDVGEMNAQPPLGVFDLQVFPPMAGKRVVVQFKVPILADYTITDLGVRRVSSQGDTATYEVYIGTMVGNMNTMQVGPSLTATNDQRWVVDTTPHLFSGLVPGTLINFTVNPEMDNDHDATEISWTITAQ